MINSAAAVIAANVGAEINCVGARTKRTTL
jgi:hypothetical protein